MSVGRLMTIVEADENQANVKEKGNCVDENGRPGGASVGIATCASSRATCKELPTPIPNMVHHSWVRGFQVLG